MKGPIFNSADDLICHVLSISQTRLCLAAYKQDISILGQGNFTHTFQQPSPQQISRRCHKMTAVRKSSYMQSQSKVSQSNTI